MIEEKGYSEFQKRLELASINYPSTSRVAVAEIIGSSSHQQLTAED
jgi:hypothetical protein